MNPVRVVAYDPSWPETFEILARPIRAVLGEHATSVEHVGSTSVPGLAAKPIIDMTIILRSEADLPAVIERLAGLGYRHLGDLGISGREAFRRDDPPVAHNLYACPPGSVGLWNHLTVRDHLRRNPAARETYAALKVRLADEFRHDLDGYLEGKSAFIRGILEREGGESRCLDEIEAANRRPPADG